MGKIDTIGSPESKRAKLDGGSAQWPSCAGSDELAALRCTRLPLGALEARTTFSLGAVLVGNASLGIARPHNTW